jgi:outer membrane protein assembly factor BamA
MRARFGTAFAVHGAITPMFLGWVLMIANPVTPKLFAADVGGSPKPTKSTVRDQPGTPLGNLGLPALPPLPKPPTLQDVASILPLPQVRERTRIRITGLQRRSEAEVLGWLGNRLVHVRSSPPSAPLADDAALILRHLLVKDGHADAKVSWSLGRDTVTLQVVEGVRLTLGEVSLNGLPPEDAGRMVRIFSSPMEKDRPLGLLETPFRESDLDEGLALVVRELKSRGYWSASAKIVQRETNPNTAKVSLTIATEPGALHSIGAANVRSSDGRGVKLTRSTQLPFVGKTASTAHINAMRQAVEEEIARRGYPDAKVLMGHSISGNTFTPEFAIDLGTRVKLRQLHIKGLVRTAEERIRQRFQRLKSGYYDEPAMNRRVRELLATGAFRSVRLETEPAGHRLIDATLHLQEGRAREVQLAVGFGSYQGWITRAIYTDRNFGGHLWALNAGLEISARGILGESRITNPWFLGTDLSASARYYALMFSREGYDTFETGVDSKWIWKPTDHVSLEFLAGMALVNLSEDGLPASELGETVYTHQKLRFTPTLDYRDHPVLPSSGWHVSAPIEIGSTIGDTSASYSRAALEAGWFIPLNRRWDVGLGAEFATLIPSNDGGDLPIDLRIFNGGARSVRSFPERELGPTANGYPTGGEAMWNANAELIRNLAGPVKAVLFVDAGTLARHHSDLTDADIECAAGLGLRLNLPIGPIRLEYGHNLTRQPGEPNGTFHFAIGCAF